MENEQNVDPRIVNWTKMEKMLLYKGLKKYGSRNIPLFSKTIIGKTEEEIKAALQFYKEDTHSSSKPKTTRKRPSPSKQSIDDWAKSVGDFYSSHHLKTEMAAALNLIAEFEPMTPPASNNNVDLKKLYKIMNAAIEGKTLQYDNNDEPTMRFLNQAITELHGIVKTM